MYSAEQAGSRRRRGFFRSLLSALSLGSDHLPEGQAVVIAGYPSTNISLALAGLGLGPSVHEGIVTAYVAKGALLEFDAQVEHGNSGGPVFDPDTALVYAMVTYKLGTDQTNLAEPMPPLLAFLQNAGVVANQSTRSASTSLADAPAEQNVTADISGRGGASFYAPYVPLRDHDQVYDCGGGVGQTLSIRRFSTVRASEENAKRMRLTHVKEVPKKRPSDQWPGCGYH